MALTPSQEAAVLYDRHLILFAGPGSGKTATSVAKGVRILSMPESKLCMVTFTTAGAGEMKERMAASFTKQGTQLPTQRLTTGTFHALMLRHFQRYGNSTKKLLSPPARSGMLNSMLSHLEAAERSEYTLALERYQGSLHPEQTVIQTLSPGPAAFIEDYYRRLKSINAIDLAGVMRECVVGMENGAIPLFSLSHLIGDEMQDADQIQLQFMLVHARAGVITTLVGDDDQTIYEWRSALGYEGLMHFAKATGAKTITLAENFRSRSEIVSHAQLVISHNNPERIDKSPKAIRGPGGVLGVTTAADVKQECANIAHALYRYRKPGETSAVLARSNMDLMLMEQALSSHVDDDGTTSPIDYKRDGQSIWQTPEVASLICLLQALIRGQTTDLMPALSLLNLHVTSRAKLEHALGANCGGFLDGHNPAGFEPRSADEGNAIQEFTKLTTTLRRHLRNGEIPFALNGAAEFMKAALKAQPRSRPKQIENLVETAHSVLSKFNGPLSQRLAAISRLQEKEAEVESVRLMTMHSSKGLEFDLVFMLNCGDQDNGSTLFDPHPERRLFYVGMTRAKNRLVVSYSGKPVRFIAESGIPPHHSIESILA